MQIDLTALIIAKNASATLAKTLQSVAFCSHVIVGDDGSDDDTIALAKAHHADVIKLPVGLDFAAKRNFLTQYAPTPWVLWIDSDERVSEQLKKEITQLSFVSSSTSGYAVHRMDHFLGRKLMHGETANTWLLRLLHTSKGKWVRPVHEIWETKGVTGKLSAELLHYSHPTLEEFIDKINLYTDSDASKRHPNFLTVAQLFLYPPAKFVQNYIIRQGYLDGFPGFVMAWMMSLHSLCVRIKVLEPKHI